MIAPDYLKRIAAWSRELNEREIEIARAGIVEKSYRANEYIFMRGDHFEYWTGVVTGLARMGIVSRGGKAASFAGLTAGRLVRRGHRAQERGTALRRGGAARHAARHDGPQDLLLAVREQRRHSTASWSDNSTSGSANSSRSLEYGRTLDATARLARSIASLFNPILYPGTDAPSRDHPGRDRGAVRYFPAERQPMPEAAGEGGAAPAGIWRGDHHRPRAAAQLWRMRWRPRRGRRRSGPPQPPLRGGSDEAIQLCACRATIASRSLSSGARSPGSSQ